MVFYFLLIRPQQKRMKEHREMLANLRRGDRIVTGGGLIGQVTKVVNENEVQVEISEDVRCGRPEHRPGSAFQDRAAQGEGGQKQQAANEQGGAKGMLNKLLGGRLPTSERRRQERGRRPEPQAGASGGSASRLLAQAAVRRS